MTAMTDPKRRVSLVGGPHDGLTVEIPARATSTLQHCWDNKPVIVKPAEGPRRMSALYTQRGSDRTSLVFRADHIIRAADTAS